MPSNVLKAIITADAKGVQKGVGDARGSIEELRQVVKGLKSELAGLDSQQLNSKGGKVLAQEYRAATAELKDLEKQTGLAGEATGNFATKAFSGLRKLAYVLPGIGVAGILGGIVTFGEELIGLGGKADKAAEELQKLLKPIAELRNEAAASTAGESSKVKALVSIVEDQTRSYKERNDALNQLKEINKSYFGDLSLEADKLIVLKDRANEYTKAIVQQAIIKEYSDQIAKLTTAYEEQVPKVAKAGAELKQFQRDAEKTGQLKLGGGQTGILVDVKNATGEFSKQAGVLTQIRNQIDQLNKALDGAVVKSLEFRPLDDKAAKAAESAGNKIIAEAKRIAEFLNKNTQFSVAFEADPSKSEAENVKAAQAFIEKARSFIEKQTPEFKFKPLVRFEPKFIPSNAFFKTLLNDSIPDAATKTYSQLKAEFEKEIKHLAENNPIVVATNAKFETGQKHEKNLFAAIGITPDNFNESKGALTEIEKNAISTARTFSDILTPAVSDFIGAIANGKNPVQAFFDGVKQAIVQLIQKLVTAAITAAIFNALLGKSSPGFGALFGKLAGFRAGGGPVDAGKSYVVGEKGPEIFTPNTGGRIIANSAVKNGLAVQGSGMHLTVGGEFVINGYNLKAIASLVNQRQNRLF